MRESGSARISSSFRHRFSLLRTATHPLFLLPAALLLASVAIFGFIEYRMEQSGAVIRDIAGDPEISMASQIQNAVWSFREAFEKYVTLERSDDNKAKIDIAEKGMNKAISDLTSFFRQTEMEARAHQVDLLVLDGLKDNIRVLQPLLESEYRRTQPDPEALMDVRRKIAAIVDSGQALSRSISITRQAEFAKFTDQIGHDERLRTWLLLLDFCLVVLLIGTLFRFVIRSKRNAELAWAAERYNAFYAAALQSIRVGVLIRDMQRKGTPVLFINHAFTELTGYDLTYMADKKSDILFGWHTDAATAEAFRTSIRQERARNFDLLIYRKNGSSFWCDWHISPVHDQDGKLTHYISLLTDITSMRQTQEALVLAKEQAEHASAVKTSFLATMSHEIRTPINGLLGVLDLLSETKLEKEQQRYLQIAINSSQSLHAIINDILDYAKMESGKLELMSEVFSLVDLLQSVADLADPVATRKGVDLKLDMQEGLPSRLEGDPGKIRQIILNLVMNAIKFTDTGSVTIRMSSLLTQEKQGRQVILMRFEVIDTGIGISVADQDKLFKEFSQIERSFTRRFGGTGLGLAICKRLVSMMGGEIGLESKQGHGSTFWFMLPVVVSDQKQTPHAALAANGDKTSRLTSNVKVLLVEDNETNQLVASRYIQKAGIFPDIVSSGTEALEACKDKSYDLIFMDISMADMDGFETTRRLRAMEGWAALVPIIALTAHVMPGDRERCLAAGMNDHLEKPLNFTSLLRMVNRWLPNGDVPTMPEDEAASSEPAADVPSPEPASRQSAARRAVDFDKPVFDADVLRRLCDDLGAEAVMKITELFLSDSAKRMADFPTLRGQAEVSVLGDKAHTLKSSSGSCGLARFSALMASVEAAAKAGDENQVFELLADAATLYAESIQALEAARKLYAAKD